MKFLAAIALLFTGIQSSAETFKFQDDFCECQGEIKKTSDLKSLNAMLASNYAGSPSISEALKIKSSIPKGEALKKAIAELDKSCDDGKKLIENQISLKTDYFLKLKADRLRDHDLNCYEARQPALFLLHNDVSHLRAKFMGREVPAKCNEFIDFLKSKAATEANFFAFSQKYCISNGDPTRCVMSMNQPEVGVSKLENMQMNILTYGWHNCVNQQFRDSQFTYMSFQDMFRPHLKKMDCTCDEP